MSTHSSGGRRTEVGVGNKGKDTYKQTRDLNGPMTIACHKPGSIPQPSLEVQKYI